MKKTFAFCAALSCAAFVAIPAVPGETSTGVTHHGRYAPHNLRGPAPPAVAQQASSGAALPPFSWIAGLGVKPYPAGQGDADGLSRNIDDCNKGCIGVNTVR